MRKYFYIILLAISITAGFSMLNIDVSTKQCINYDCRSIKLPLYLKLLDFFDRHYNYKRLVREIANDRSSEEERVIRIFEWTYLSIKRVPQGLPVIDDHIWYTIVRGYGAKDQFCDIFTTLCNHAGIEAFFTDVFTKDGSARYPFSFVKIKGNWVLFDPYNGIYFKDRNNALAGIAILRSNGWQAASIAGESKITMDYRPYFDNLSLMGDRRFTRANLQSPLNRLFFELKKRLNL